MAIKETIWPSSIPMDRSDGRPEPLPRKQFKPFTTEQAIKIIRDRLKTGRNPSDPATND